MQVAKDTDEPDRLMQTVLVDLRLIPELKYALLLDIHTLPKGKAQDEFKRMMKAVTSLAAMLVAGFPRAQELFYEDLELLTCWFNLGVGVSNTIKAVFQGNRALCERVPPELIYQYGREIHSRARGFQPHQLSFLQARAEESKMK